jgi:hypothetical protein
MTTWLLATTPPPSSFPHTGICVAYDVGEAVEEFPSAAARDESNP